MFGNELLAAGKFWSKDLALRKAALIGNHTPRRCGLATFTADVASAISSRGVSTQVVAMNDCREGYGYPRPVCFEVFQDDPGAYGRAAQFLNLGGFDVANLQHEYGIFGGPEGNSILLMLKELGVPLVTTLHTILREPTPNQKAVLEEIIQLSERVIVMSHRGQEMLQEIHAVDPGKIDYIPHGVPDVQFEDTAKHKHALSFGDRPVMMTFGLVSPDKGIENALRALPAIVEKHPDILYLIVGETHPKIRAQHGESYRESLEALAHELGLEKNVRFHNVFAAFEELVEYLLASDIYLTPYLKMEQITSGTLSYALGCGKAIVSTPYWHAEELLADNRGILVPPRSPGAISEAVLSLLDSPQEMESMRQRAYGHGRDMVWQNVGEMYIGSFEKARSQSRARLSSIVRGGNHSFRSHTLPPLDFRHLRAMTDDTGILQHSKFDIADRNEGYCVDDNARALLAACNSEVASALDDLAPNYLSFINHAFHPGVGRFRNFMSFERTWLEEAGSEDSHGRTVWALGNLIASDKPCGWQSLGLRLFNLALPAVQHFTSPRAWAFVLLGLHPYLRTFSGDRFAKRIQKLLAYRLFDQYQSQSDRDWKWFEPVVAYDNARLPQALMLTGHDLGEEEMQDCALEALEWLSQHQTGPNGIFVPIGNMGFWRKGSDRAWFDQQPVDACATIAAARAAFEITNNIAWLDEAERAFAWFLGRNSLKQALYDPETGGCRDGLQADRLNENKGAESTLAFLLALQDMIAIRHEQPATEVRYLG